MPSQLVASLLFTSNIPTVLTSRVAFSSPQSVVYIHIRGGYLFIALILTHVVAWVVVWAQNGSGPDDLWSFVWDYQSDNFTNPLVLAATYLTFFMGFMSQNAFRRKFFEFFYLLHQATFLMLTAATFWHAASSWYLLTPGVVIWMYDRWRRVGDKCIDVRIVDVEVFPVGNSEEVAKLTVKVSEERVARGAKRSTQHILPRSKTSLFAASQGRHRFVRMPLIFRRGASQVLLRATRSLHLQGWSVRVPPHP